jgi:hypothetical protein
LLHLSDNIKIIRALVDETQPIFAKRFTGVTTGMQKTYESGGTPPGPLYLQELSDIAGVTIDDLLNKALRKEDINLGQKAKKVNGQAHYTPDQLFAMFLHVTEAQTAILDKIKGDTGKVVATTENLWNGLQALAMRQGGDREILLNSLARLEGKGENELIAEANRKITELALSAARQGKSDEVRSPHTESKGP